MRASPSRSPGDGNAAMMRVARQSAGERMLFQMALFPCRTAHRRAFGYVHSPPYFLIIEVFGVLGVFFKNTPKALEPKCP